jgi:hypothetical protein
MRGNATNLVNSIWMNFERMKTAAKNRELLGLEPFYLLKSILERQQANGWGKNNEILFIYKSRYFLFR